MRASLKVLAVCLVLESVSVQVIVLLLLVLVSEAVAVYSGGVGESEEGHREGRSAGCNPIISHYLQLNNYYLTTCYNGKQYS